MSEQEDSLFINSADVIPAESNASIIPMHGSDPPYGSTDIPDELLAEISNLERAQDPCVCPSGNPLGKFCEPLTNLLVFLYNDYPKTFSITTLVMLMLVFAYSLDTGNYLNVNWLLGWLSCIFLHYC